MQWEGAQIKGCEFHQNRQNRKIKKSGKAAGIGGIQAEL